jgi:bacterioferritin-associated ferredoxin
MIVCLCNNVSDRKIRQAVDAGLNSMSALRQELDVATCCGKCHGCAREILRECLDVPASRTHASAFASLALAA